jgi:hypothetical protein
VPKLPKKATVDLKSGKVFFDGEEVPWYIEEGGVDILDLGSKNSLPLIQLRLFADTIEVLPADPRP